MGPARSSIVHLRLKSPVVSVLLDESMKKDWEARGDEEVIAYDNTRGPKSSGRYASANLCDYYAGDWLANDDAAEILGGSRHCARVRYEPLLLRDRTSVLGIRLVDFNLAVIRIFLSIMTQKAV